MVFVGMGKKDRIEMFNILSQHLVAEIRTGINDERGIGRLNQYTRTKALVFFIRRSADLAITTDHWNTAAGTCSQEYDFYRRI
jgi:hypothetical protein